MDVYKMDYKAIGNRIRKLRVSKGFTQEKLAKMAGVSFPFVGHIERGTRKMSVETLLAIARALDCSVDFLLGNRSSSSDAYALALQRIEKFVQDEILDASSK